jgi:hypothetical protein
MGTTEPGQRVTAANVAQLPPGSVVRNGDGSRLIHLHDGLWLWCYGYAWTYDRIEYLARRLDEKSVVCHVPPNVKLSGEAVRSDDLLDLLSRAADEIAYRRDNDDPVTGIESDIEQVLAKANDKDERRA